MLRPRALDHVGLKVRDMDRSLRFYCEALGLELLRRRDRGGGVTSAVLRVGSQELNVFSRADFSVSPRDDDPAGLDHFCLEIEAASVDAVIADLGTAGVAIAQGPVTRSDGTSLFVDDPDGCRVELIVKC
ncbi:VOC family protein [Reyranella sp.]|uniref:VOC family protein n=1 Tax=Reyranella sp. TaxID=1929291 RepID=UPI003BACE91F